MDESADDDGRGAGPAPTLLIATDAIYGRQVGLVRWWLIALRRLRLDVRRRLPPRRRHRADSPASIRVDVDRDDPIDEMMVW